MQLTTTDLVEGRELDALRTLYDRAFDDLRSRAAQRHALTHAEFDEVMGDKRVTKHVVADLDRAGRPCGLSTLTNDLSAVPLISPEFYAARWPQTYARQQIWYVGFLAIDPDYHGTGVLGHLINSITTRLPSEGSVVAVDICQFNDDQMRLPEVFARLAGTFTTQPTLRRLDAQTYWAYELGTPA